MAWKETNEALEGLVTLWNPITIKGTPIPSTSNRYLHVSHSLIDSNYSFIATNLYAPNILSNRKRVLDAINLEIEQMKDSPES